MSDDMKEARRLVDNYRKEMIDPDGVVWPWNDRLVSWGFVEGGLSRLLSKIEEMEREIAGNHEDSMTAHAEWIDEKTRLNARAEAAERTAADKAAEVERLAGERGAYRGMLGAVLEIISERQPDADTITKWRERFDALSPPPTDSTTFPTPSPMTARIAEPYEPSAETQATLKAIEENRRRAHALASTTFVGNDSFPAPSVPGKHIISGSDEG